MSKQKTIQEIFNIVIKNKFYVARMNRKTGRGTDLMCHALSSAYVHDVITMEEKARAKVAINDYLRGHLYLQTLLYTKKRPCSFGDRKFLYQHWDFRPRFRK